MLARELPGVPLGLSASHPSTCVLTHMKRVDIFLPLKYQADIFFLLIKRVNIVLRWQGLKHLFFIIIGLRYIFLANMRAEIFISKKYQPPPL